jgi:hypothetical protein
MNESTHHLQDMIGLFYVVRNVLIQHSSTLLGGSNHLPITTCTKIVYEKQVRYLCLHKKLVR